MMKRKPQPQPQPKLTREQAMDARAVEDRAHMARVNAKPIDFGLLEPEQWMHKGGGAGFSINGMSVRRVR
jgi:hypothetical protein